MCKIQRGFPKPLETPLGMPLILLYLYHLGCMPKVSTELYHHFICQTVCRCIYLAESLKSGHEFTQKHYYRSFNLARDLQQDTETTRQALNYTTNWYLITSEEIKASHMSRHCSYTRGNQWLWFTVSCATF